MLASVLCCAAGAAQAQGAKTPSASSKTAAPAAVEGVTVDSGPKARVIEKQSHAFVQSYAAPTAELDQVARWDEPVCIQVEGLPAAQTGLVVDRVADVARAVGLRAQEKGCHANIEIVFTAQPQALMDDVAKRRETLLGYFHRHDRDKLKLVTHPIQAWYVTATQGGGGSNAAMFYGVNMQPQRNVVDDPDNPAPTGCGINPHFTACLQAQLKNAFIVADAKALDGKDLRLLSDYLVMLALSQPRSLDGCNNLASVIDALSKVSCSSEVPDGLTPGDAAYLTALYSADMEGKKQAQETDIALRMAKILTKAAVAAR
ncbi:MAG: hypothetical protein WDN45_04610 [Caulobacteraceae bacterium]